MLGLFSLPSWYYLVIGYWLSREIWMFPMLLLNILFLLLMFDCTDVDECQERKACQCSACSCKNTWGSYECSCSGDLLYIRDHDTCISKSGTEVRSAWAAVWVILLGLVMAGGGGYLIYKYRLRSYMDSEIRAIMAQYMPLDSQAEVPNHVHDERT
ncbi:hypothetical protein NC652_024233 [Populus alba x Populus x berolinensis]|nr:hypothetical protein NC652_024233 [Populus alba x Populus x berolinensis]